jgi:hypothetical protein
MELPSALIVGVDQVARRYAEVAPGAPAVPHVERPPRVRRTRFALARGLVRVARAIAPPEAVPR